MLRRLLFTFGIFLMLSSCSKDTQEQYYTLRVVPDAGGSVSNTGYKSIPGATLTLTAKEGTSVTITAYPEEGYQFDGWSTGKSTNPYTLVLDKNLNLEAYFSAN